MLLIPKVAGLASAALVVLHVACILIGAPAYRYFGAGEEIARLAEQGSWVPAAITSLLAAVFAGFAVVAFSAAGTIRPLPFLRAALVAIGGIYTLRGLLLFPQIAFYVQTTHSLAHRELVFSAVSLVIGGLYIAASCSTGNRSSRWQPSRA